MNTITPSDNREIGKWYTTGEPTWSRTSIWRRIWNWIKKLKVNKEYENPKI